MNPIPSIFNEHQISLTVLGGKESVPNIKMSVAAILINKGWSSYRSKMIENLMRCGFSEIISIEADPNNYSIEDFSRKFPFVKIVIPLDATTEGDLINIGVAESSSDYVLVLRDSLDFTSDILTPTLAAKLTESGTFCITPRLLGKDNFSFPVLFSPSIRKACLNVLSTSVVSDGVANLFPFDNIGLYSRRKFIDLGGFDYTIHSKYWQNLDFAFRSWLWGEKIIFSTAFSLSYGTEIPVLDNGANQFSNRFYLKNLVPRFYADHGSIPLSSFFAFWGSSSCGFFEARARFKEAREWVMENKYRFKRDALDLVENWG
ncbi:hypothetical protein [uncultured Treponema sp.]|uniref:hypothetical protein n=1 Tax=uncultured Treponema sp. TaxID=162155 RepID=UPI0025D31A57|nr:hypothetical protein [uncultured Treponema sp.]